MHRTHLIVFVYMNLGQVEHLIKRVGGSAVPISRLYSSHPRPYQQAVREALLRGLTTVGFGLHQGTYKPCPLEKPGVATGKAVLAGASRP